MKPPTLTYGSHGPQPEKLRSFAPSRTKTESYAESEAKVASDAARSHSFESPPSMHPSTAQDEESSTLIDESAVAGASRSAAHKHQRHICCPKRCLTRASTSSSSSDSLSFDLLNDRSRPDKKKPASHEVPAAHSLRPALGVLSPIASDDGELGMGIKDIKGRRRSWGLLTLKKLSKRHAGQSDEYFDIQHCHSAPASRRNSFDMSPACTLVSLPDHASPEILAGDVSEIRVGRRGLKRPFCCK